MAAILYDVTPGGPYIAYQPVVSGKDPCVEDLIAATPDEVSIIRIQRDEIGKISRRDPAGFAPDGLCAACRGRVEQASARAAARRGENGFVEGWRAGGLIAQFLPEAPERMRLPDLPGGDAPEGVDDPEGSFEPDDSWVEVRALVDTIDASELADPDVGVERLLFRLFHERGVRVFPAKPVADDCSCTRERIGDVLSNFSQEEIGESVEDGKIAVTCEFCGEGYEFDPAEFEADATSGDAPASE